MAWDGIFTNIAAGMFCIMGRSKEAKPVFYRD